MYVCIVKALTLPLTTKQLESTTKMQQLQPYTQKIQKAYANDEQTRNQLTAQLFQTANVNPLAGCLPALVQIPIFISLYRALQNLVAENKLDEPFLWIPDLEGPVYSNPPSTSLDWLKSVFSGNPTLGWHDTLAFLSLPLILYVSQSVSMKILQPPKDPNKVLTEQEQVSQGILNQLPFIVAFFAVNVPAGLSVYWIINNILTTVITVVVKQQFSKIPVPVEVAQMMAAVDAAAAGGVSQKQKGRGPSGAMNELRGQGGSAADSRTGGFSASNTNFIDAEVGSATSSSDAKKQEDDDDDDDDDDESEPNATSTEGLSRKRQKGARKAARAADKKKK